MKPAIATKYLSASHWWRLIADKIVTSLFIRNTIWYTALNGLERVFALAQTVLLARSLGITEYGVYGLLFGTIGLVASSIGLQMGLTSTVYVAKYKHAAKEKAALLIRYVNRFALLVALGFCLLVVPFTQEISVWLLSSDKYAGSILIGIFFVGMSVLVGVQGGVVEGFEDFRSVALVRLSVSLLSLLTMYPAARTFGLYGVMVLLFLGVLIRYLVMSLVVRHHWRINGFPAKGAGMRFSDVVLGFSLPSVLVSVMVGGVTWFGTFLLSRQAGGFDGVAILNTSLQWRAPVLLLASSLGAVALPVFSRLSHEQGDQATGNFRRKLLYANGAMSVVFALIVSLLSGDLLPMYGEEFLPGQMVFAILVMSVIPQVLANVYMQDLLGSGKAWKQFQIQLCPAITMGMAFLVLIPEYQTMGYALSMAIGMLVFFAAACWRHWRVTESR